MRIALLTTQWPGARMGGIGSYTRQAAAALARAGHDTHVFTFTLPSDARQNIPPGVKLHETPDLATLVSQKLLPSKLAATLSTGGEGLYRLALASLLCAAFRESHNEKTFDILESPDVEALALPLLCGPDIAIPIATHLHCCTAIAQQINAPPTPIHPTVAALEFASIHLSDALCAPTNAVVELTRTVMPLNQQSQIIPHPFVCSNEPFTPPSPTGDILFIGRLERLKGVEALTHALNIFLPRNPTARFTFIGPDTSTAPAGHSMRHFVQQHLTPDIANRVAFTGELPPTDVAKHLSQAQFVVLPSLCENFSLACCESLAAGRALIVSSDTGSVELIGTAGLIAKRGDAQDLSTAMENLHRDPALTHDLSKKAYNHARRAFDPLRIAQLKTDFYQTVIDSFDPNARRNRFASLPSICTAPLFVALSSISTSFTAPPNNSTPGHRLLSIMRDIQQQTGRPAQVLLYGAGKHTSRLLSERHLWESQGHRILALIDDHPRFLQSPTYLDFPVHPLKSAPTTFPIILSTDTYEDQFWQQTAPLRARGTPVYRLYNSIPTA